MKNTQIVIGIIIVLLIVAGAFAFIHIEGIKSQLASTTPAPAGNAVQYSCTQGTIAATFTDSQATLVLSDGRMLVLPQVVSGSGTRYEKGAIAFVGKGSNAFLTENGATTYENCIAGATSGGMTGDTGAGTKTFTDSSKTFSFAYPSMFSVTGGGVGYSTDWSSGTTQLGLVLARVTIPQSFEPKTNFGDARFTVGTSADPDAVKNCLVNQNGNPSTKSREYRTRSLPMATQARVIVMTRQVTARSVTASATRLNTPFITVRLRIILQVQ
jgi:membrane-bound inhibitor of C-type lysozyme